MNQQKRYRNFTVISGVFAMFFTGFSQIWTIYVPYIHAQTKWNTNEIAICYHLSFLAFVFGNIFGGKLHDKVRTNKIILVGGMLEVIGVLFSGIYLGDDPISLMPLYLFYGLVQGFGQGMLYSVILVIMQKWFPTRKGMATGMVITANGLCGFFLTPISHKLLSEGGTRITFLVVSGMMALSVILAFFGVKEPRECERSTKMEECKVLSVKYQFTHRKMLHTKRFYVLLLVLSFGLMPYLLISPLSQQIQLDSGIPLKVTLISIMGGSIVNALMRLVVPSLADKIGRIKCLYFVLAVSVLSVIGILILTSWRIVIAILAIYGCYGGIMGSLPAIASSLFGMKHAGENYGYILLGAVMATLSASIISRIQINMEIEALFIVCLCYAILSFVMLHILSRLLNKN